MYVHLFFQILFGIIVGWLAGIVVQGRGLGLLPDLIIGALGAFVGAFIVRYFHIPIVGFWESVAVPVGGAVVLLIVLRLFRHD
jgi:uncharacterized membrane protein YeaQ/YmgE (transglycosylase-associated protein family)